MICTQISDCGHDHSGPGESLGERVRAAEAEHFADLAEGKRLAKQHREHVQLQRERGIPCEDEP